MTTLSDRWARARQADRRRLQRQQFWRQARRQAEGVLAAVVFLVMLASWGLVAVLLVGPR